MFQIQQKKLSIPRLFTCAEKDVFEGINFVERLTKLSEFSGKVLEESIVIAPDFWSQLSVNVYAQKYLRKAGVPEFLKKVHEEDVPKWLQRSVIDEAKGNSKVAESDIRMVIHRLAGTWTYWAWKANYFESEESARAFYDEIRYMILFQKAAPNSPQFFNTGIHWAYGIEGGTSQGHYYYEPTLGKVVQSSSAYERPQVHACFIQSIEDNLIEEGGILDLAMRQARIYKFGSGSGTNYSQLRAQGEPLSMGGKSSGMMSFLRLYDAVGGIVKSGGTTRRAAAMVTTDVDHPEIFKYCSLKVEEENKVISMIVGSEIVKDFLDQALQVYKESGNADIKTNPRLFDVVANAYANKIPVSYISQVLSLLSQGITEFTWEVFNTNYDGAAYATVTGQNANNSVRVTKEFLDAVINDEEVKLTYRTDPKKFTKAKAKTIWSSICRAAWSCGDPGVQYDTNINDWHTCPNSGRINASNPCSEYMFLDNTACNLASLNLVTFEKEDGSFDKSAFVYAVRLWTLVLEISVHMAQYPSKEIARLSYEFRTLGLGYCNLGTLLMRAGMPYDSDQGRSYAAYITALMHGASCEMSADMAEKFGPFAGFKLNREPMLEVMQNHRRAVTGEKCHNVSVQPLPINKKFVSEADFQYLLAIWDRVISKGQKHGYRNAQVTLLAPTGTIALGMAADTGGIEPGYSAYFFKQLAGGGYIIMINNSTPIALKRLGYEDSEIEDILEYMLGTRSFDKSHIINRDELIKRGLNDEEVNLLNKALPGTDSIESIFSQWVLGENLFKRLNIPESELKNPSFNLLNFLRFNRDQITDSDLHICGRLTIEGAPHLKSEHLPIFDCANKSGHGERFIKPEGHVLMMAAVQPFLSGAISKTVNTPESATIEDFSKLMLLGKDHLIKAISVFRDRSKQSSAISSKATQALETGLKKALPKNNISERAQREILPPKRNGYTQRVTIGGAQNIFYHTTGENKDGDVREIFISGGDHQGPAFKELMHCFVKLFSISLQYGTPLEVLVNSFAYTEFPPNGVVSGDPNIRFAKSWIDYIIRQVGIHYREMNHLGHSFTSNKSENEERSESRYTGEVCQNPKCRSVRMRREGTCSYCEDCFSSTGCG